MTPIMPREIPLSRPAERMGQSLSQGARLRALRTIGVTTMMLVLLALLVALLLWPLATEWAV